MKSKNLELRRISENVAEKRTASGTSTQQTKKHRVSGDLKDRVIYAIVF